jgi:hypothetical protein
MNEGAKKRCVQQSGILHSPHSLLRGFFTLATRLETAKNGF